MEIFANRRLLEGLNESVICLLPKGITPSSLYQFRPISLCNVSVKCVSKILANRLKLIISKLMTKNQSSFIPERLTSDNIIVAEEIIHTLSRRKGVKGDFIVNVDLEKA